MALMIGIQSNRASNRLSEGETGLDGFDAVVSAISDQMRERFREGV
jgi:hypothetical protein